jgi:hypothetical protein
METGTHDGKRRQPSQSSSWQPMALTYVGDIGEVLHGGGGKLSPVAVDPGEHRKTKPSG